MTYFSDDPTTGTSTDDQANSSNQEDFVAQVVAEKGEQWKDPQALAKGYVHAQKRIKELEALEAQSAKQDFAKELLEQLRAQAPAPVPAPVVAPNTGSEEENTTPSAEDIQSLIETKLTERESQRTLQENLAKADRLLVESFGTEATSVVEAKAKELGLTKDRLTSIAGESPSAFIALMGKSPSKETNDVSSSSKNTLNLAPQSTERNKAYYTQLRKDNSKLYYHPNTQKQMLADAERLGANFYGV